jgi:hydroxymethylcytosylglucuronate/cytosylglucuronate synthase
MPDNRQPTLLVAASDFGWGSLGKLRLILDELSGIAIAPDPAAALTPTIRSVLGDRHSFVDCEREEASVGLVVNDARIADEWTASGLPVIYVDSLPYLWTVPEEIPRSVAVYCAQKSPAPLAPDSPLANRQDIVWVDPLVPRADRTRGRGGIVINVGGLHSHLAGDSTGAYVRLAVMPLARLLSSAGHSVTAVCGNLPGWAVAELSELLPAGTRIGLQRPHEFERTLLEADSLITSPGSTTILQAAAIGLPISLLPPQNLSQILNAQHYSSAATPSCGWPTSVIDRGTVDTLRPAGEDVVLEYIYSQIVRASADGVGEAVMTARFAAMLDELVTGAGSPEHVTALGFNGASQVAQVVRQAMLARHPASTAMSQDGAARV